MDVKAYGLIVALAAFLDVVFIDAAKADVFSLNSGHGPPLATDEQDGFVDTLEREILRRLGHDVVIQRVPAERSLLNVDTGIDDGNGPRIAGLTRLYPNIRQVSEPIMTYDFVAFTRDVDFVPTNWDSLRPYDTAIINGWKILEKNVVGTRSLTKVRGPEQLFALLMQGRVDVVIFEKWEGLHLIRELGLEGVRMLDPPLAQRDMYLYVNQKHEALLAPMAETLRQIKADGTYQSIFDDVLAELERH